MNKKDSKTDTKKGSPTPTAKTGTPSKGIKPQPVASTPTPKTNTPTPANNTPQAPKTTPTPNITVVTPPGTQTPTPNKFSWGG
mgnify:CR=1 FL=1